MDRFTAASAEPGALQPERRDVLASVRDLGSAQLLSRVQNLASLGRGTMAALVAHLGELEVRDLHLAAGFGSLFSYCREALALSEADAYHHVQAARVARRFPVILELLEKGDVNLTTVRLLGP